VSTSENSGRKKNPWIAALLSLIFLGGGGQIYCGYIKRGLLIVACTIIFAIIGIGFGGILPYGLGVIDAFSLAKAISDGNQIDEFERIGTLWL
jgi:TM2 domain-containing membrane protein YozV